MARITTIIFDLGGVLIDWNPRYVFDKVFEDEEKKEFFFKNICTADWNEEQDAGRPIAEATSLLVNQYPEWEPQIRAYYDRWEEMLGGPIMDTVEIFRKLRESKKFKLFALTNWSGELFPVALQKYDFLHWFDGRVVSGDEKMRKPFLKFYKLIIDRYNLNPQETLFIDDSLRNIHGAKEAGLQTIHFQSPAQLENDLMRLQLL